MPSKKVQMPQLRDYLHPGESNYFKQNPDVAGMAADDDTVILNPFSDPSINRDAVVMNEQSRILMRNGTVVPPAFDLTPEQIAAFKGTEYEKDREALRATIAARILTGDPSALDTTPQQRAYVEKMLTPMFARK